METDEEFLKSCKKYDELHDIKNWKEATEGYDFVQRFVMPNSYATNQFNIYKKKNHEKEIQTTKIFVCITEPYGYVLKHKIVFEMKGNPTRVEIVEQVKNKAELFIGAEAI